MVYAVGLIVFAVIFSLLKDQLSNGQSKSRKTRSTSSGGPIHHYGDYEDKDHKWSSDDSSYDGSGSDGGSDGGGGGGE